MNFKEEILVFCGPMRAGKTSSLLLYLDKLRYAKIPYLIFKPRIDNKGPIISSRFMKGSSEPAISIDPNKPTEINNYIDFDNLKIPFTIAIDEAQFFSHELVDVINHLHSKGINFVISGLDQDANGKTFGPMGNILALATNVKKLTAVCEKCKAPSTKTGLCLPDPDFEKSNIKIGDSNYLSLCSRCYYLNTDSKN